MHWAGKVVNVWHYSVTANGAEQGSCCVTVTLKVETIWCKSSFCSVVKQEIVTPMQSLSWALGMGSPELGIVSEQV